jgi:hypothetical protein
MSETGIELGDNDSLLPFYVYVLADKASEQGGPEVFYVGKGQGQRLDAHEGEFERLVQTDGDLTKHPKFERLQAMRMNGRQPLVRVIGRFETSDEALAVETVAIKYFYGIENLCNKVHGRGAEYCRAKGDWEIKPGLEQEKTPKTATGEETERNKALLAGAGAYQLLEELKQRLLQEEASGVALREFNENGNRAFHPGEGNGQLAVLFTAGEVDWMISFTASKKFSLTLANTVQTRSQRSWLEECWPSPCLEYLNNIVRGEPRYGVFYRSQKAWDERHGSTGWLPGKESEVDSALLRAKFATMDGVLKELELSVAELRRHRAA